MIFKMDHKLELLSLFINFFCIGCKEDNANKCVVTTKLILYSFYIGMKLSTSIWRISQIGFWRRILLGRYQYWKPQAVRWYTSHQSPASTWMRPTLRRSCSHPTRLRGLNRKCYWRFIQRLVIFSFETSALRNCWFKYGPPLEIWTLIRT